MPLPFNKTLDLKLISLVKENSVLYNTRHPKYMDFDLREVVWQKIGDALNRPALEFAGLQCQVQYGDFHEDKHKPGMIDPTEFLPKGRSYSRGMESKILKEHRKHQGLSELDAKHLYTKTARELPTYGVTFFLVKEQQKGKKKLVPRLLGINAESILRLSEETKEVLQVWPLTQVKTYHAGKSETFTLNFGDYSDKEYCVKTNDAHRIRDILQGYIDIIKKRMDAQFRMDMTEHHAIMEDHVEASRGLTMEHVSQNSSKIVQETFVGPSKIISYEPGQQISQGTQIVTVQQIVVTGKGGNQQNVVMGEVPMRKDMSMEFVRKLNRLNSNSVKIVTFLTEPTESNMAEARKLVEAMQADMPSIEEGVNAAAQKQGSDDARKKLLDELRELRDCMKALTDATIDHIDPEKGEEAAKNIADLSTQMYFSLDPRTVKRGEFCREYLGPPLDPSEVEELEKAAEDKMGKLNAAVALYLTAYSDPKNIDYSAAVTSMNTINELLPELVKDAQKLSSVKDGKSREEFLDQVQALCDAAKKVCLSSRPDDHEKIQEAANEYGRVSQKLLFTFKRMRNKGDETDKQNELIELAKDVGHKTTLLLVKANELSSQMPDDPRVAKLDDAGVKCADGAKDLLACATLTAPSIHEPHCQSALTASAEALSSHAQHLALTWKPLVDEPHLQGLGEELRDRTFDLAKALDRLKQAFAGLNGTLSSHAQNLALTWKPLVDEPHLQGLGEELRDRTFDLAKALDRLKQAFAGLNGTFERDEDSPEAREQRRLKFITSVSGARKGVDNAEVELNQPYTGAPIQGVSAEELKRRMAEKIAQLTAALAALVAASADRDKPDYATADLAVDTISELMPEIVKDGKALSAGEDDQARAQLLAELRALCDATRDICTSSESGNPEALNNSAAKLANTSGKLFYVFNPRANQEKEHEIIDLSSAACQKASQMLAGVHQLASEVGGEAREDLEAAGARVADAANALLTAAQLTAPCIQDPRCQATLASSADALSHASQALASAWAPLVRDPRYQAAGNKLEEDRRQLQEDLDRLKRACRMGSSGMTDDGDDDKGREARRLKFVATVGNAKKRVNDAEAQLSKPLLGAPATGASAEELKQKIMDRIAQLNAALATLVAATADRSKPDYAKADRAVATITELMPQVVKDGKALSAGEDDQARAQLLADLKALCDATRDICASSENGNLEDLNKSAVKFGNTSGKLFYVFNPRANQGKEHEIIDLSSAACQKATEMLAGVHQLASDVGGAPGSDLDAAGARVADAANALLASAQLTAPCIQDPRCQSTLTSSADALSHASEALASTWAPLVRDPRYKAAGKKLEEDRRRLQEDLDRLKNACRLGASGMAGGPDADKDRETRRLKFIATIGNAKKRVNDAEAQLSKPIMGAPVQGAAAEDLKKRMADRIAQLNAALAALVAASADRNKPEYAKADQAVATITELMPQIVKDGKALSAGQDDTSRAEMLADLKALCDAARAVCASSESGSLEDLNRSAVNFGNTSGKLFYVFNPRANQGKEHEIIDLSSAACQKANRLLGGVQQLASDVGGAHGQALDVGGAKLADAANALLASAQLTAPCVEDSRCQASLVASAAALSGASQALASAWAPLVRDPRYEALGKQLEEDRRQLQEDLDRLKKACLVAPSASPSEQDRAEREKRRLQFVSSAAAAHQRVDSAEKELDKPAVAAKARVSPAELQQRLARAAAQLNAAMAALVAAIANRENADYAAADQAMATINQILPQVIKDTKTLSAGLDEPSRAALLADARALCDVTRAVCSSVAQPSPAQELTTAAGKFAGVSGKLVYAFDPCANQLKDHEIMDISSLACEKASQLLNGVYQLAAEADAASGARLDVAGAAVADAANVLLTTAQLTSPSIQDPSCQETLISSADSLTAAADALAGTWAPVVEDPRFQEYARKLEEARREMEKELDRLRRACRSVPSGVQAKHLDPVQERQRLQFVNIAAAADTSLQKAQKELDKPLVPTRADQTPGGLQSKLAQSLAQLNAAIAMLLAATADRDKPNYDEAEQAIHTINQLMPQVIKETKSLSATKDASDRAAMLHELRAACHATRGLCASLRDGDTQHAAKLAAKVAKLTYVVSPQQQKHQKIPEASALACQKASRMASDAYQLAEEVPDARDWLLAAGTCTADAAASLLATAQASRMVFDAYQLAEEVPDARDWLLAAGTRTADAAASLLATAQLVAPCINERQSQAALLCAADTLHQSGQSLADLPPSCGQAGRSRLTADWKELADAIEKLKAVVHEEGSVKRRVAPPPPKRTVSRSISDEVADQLLKSGVPAGARSARDINQEFLERLRCEEGQDIAASLSAAEAKSKKKAEEEEKAEFARNVGAAATKIRKAEEDVTKLYSSKDEVIPALSVDQTLVVQKQMEQKVALASVAVADLVACNHSDAMDLPVALKSTTTLTDLMPHIVQDAKLLRGTLNDNERKAFLADVLGLFDATKKVLDSTKDDRTTLDKSAVEFANKSAKLLYVVSTDVDPSQEKEVLDRVRVINESASRLAELGADAAGGLDAQQARALCRAGGTCAEAATALAYTAKLVAPSIQNSNSHEALAKASTNLSNHLQEYSATWNPLETTKYAVCKQLKTEAAGLEGLLKELRKDLGSGQLVKRRAVERVEVEDTPLRQLACVVLEGAKRKAESVHTAAELRVKYAKYANQLGQAIKELDLANHRCRQAVHDKEKRQDLEYAVQNLQVHLLQARPSLDDRTQNNIVDLTDYVKDIASDAEQLKKVCKDGQNELQTIKDHCDNISAHAARVMTPPEPTDGDADGGFGDIQEVEQFAEECDKRINAINAVIEGLPDGKLKIDLQEKATQLAEDCNMLRFAAKSALATSQSVSLDATLDDLTELEARMDEMLVPGEKTNFKKPSSLGAGRARLVRACSRACSGSSASLAPALAAHAHDVRAATDLSSDAERDRSKAHLKKVLHHLRALTMTTSRHVATWQRLAHPETAAITGLIIKELDSHERTLTDASGKPVKSVLSDVDMNKLLFPAEVQVKGDKKQVADKLRQTAKQLSSAASTVAQGKHGVDGARAAADAAVVLASLAANLRTHDLAQNQKIDEATKEMCLQTYNVLKTADMADQEPNNYAARRRLLDACRLLNDAINQLVRTTVPTNKMQQECRELLRNMQLQQSLLQATPRAACAMPYAECVDALHSQSDVLQKMETDEPMSREQFARTLAYASAAVGHSTECAAQCAYLISVAEQDKDVALTGFVDTSRLMNLSEAVQDTCHRIIRTDVEQAKAEQQILSKQVQDLQQAITEARERTKDSSLKKQLEEGGARVDDAAKVLYAVVNEMRPDRAKITSWTIKLVDAVKSVDATVEGAAVAPEPKNVSPDTKARCDDILNHSRTLSNNMMSLVRDVAAAEDADPMTWVMFGARRTAVLDAFRALVQSVRDNGKKAEVLEKSQSDLEEEDAPKKSYVAIQLDLANKWLRKPNTKAEVKAAGDNAAKNIIELGEKMAADLKGTEQEEVLQLVAECKALLADCNKKYDQEKARGLMERLKELRKTIERGVVTMVVEDFLEGEEPLADLDILADAEKDDSKRKFLLERKIAELLAHLARVSRTARLVAAAGAGGAQLQGELLQCSDQTELLAPMLVKAAQQRVVSPDDQAAIEHYQKLLSQYAESLANVRSLCDQAVDPMEFVQTAGETMQRMREESEHKNDPQKCAYASMAITKLANRVINVSLSSNDVRRDPELQKALKEAKERLRAAVPAPNARPSRMPDWKDTTAEILRTTGEVESVLGGEMIFKKQQQADQPIFAAAFGLHAAVREWSARDNAVVAAARRMAVLMAKLSDYMNTDRKRELLATTKSIVAESHEVAELARKLAHECTDVRIKTNLLQVCERIPTISGQLKMLATVKGSTLGHQELKEDQEAMIMLVGNAQNLMSSVQEVVKAAASATVVIASQRAGARMRWVRKNYY